MNVRLRLMTTKDILEAMRLKDIAGWNQTVRDWKQFLSANPEGCFAAEYEGRLIGTSTTIVYAERLAWIGMVLVDRQHRGQGIGTALLEHAIRYLDSRNIPCIKLDATPQGKPLYEKLGFTGEYAVERWMLKRQPSEKSARTSFVQIQDVLHLDKEIFGTDRGELLRSAAEDAPEFALIANQGSGINGYAFGRRGSLADHLGPWMACNEEAAARLLDQFLSRSNRELVFVDCLRQNPWAISLVKNRGFEFSRLLTRMFRGANTYAGRPDLLCAILGPEFG
jgi:GNAT superfamily N-acetyltransferase